MQSQVLECLTSHLHFKLIIQNNENSGMWRSQKPVTWAIHVITRSWQALSHYEMNPLMWQRHSRNCEWWAVERQHSLERLEGDFAHFQGSEDFIDENTTR